VAVKKFLDQEFYGDALAEFRCEVCEHFMILIFHKLNVILLLLFPLVVPESFDNSLLIGEDYAPASSSKYCTLYGCSNTASTLVHCIRIPS
jgi:hypothetical protein